MMQQKCCKSSIITETFRLQNQLFVDVGNLKAIAGRIGFEKGKQKYLNLLIDISTSAHNSLS